jgi:hypothetical protein
MNSLPKLASNCDPPDLYLLSSYDYSHEPLALGKTLSLKIRPGRWLTPIILATQEMEIERMHV